MIRTIESQVGGKRPRSRANATGSLSLREAGRVSPGVRRLDATPTRREQADDEAARERLLRAALPRVLKIARQYEGLGLPLLDLVQAGSMGLMRAEPTFDLETGAPRHGQSSRKIRQGICRALACLVHTFRFPGPGACRSRTTAPTDETTTKETATQQAAAPGDIRAGSHTLR
jgi:DNA-directed RNA polymerase sigma subunit (sigma70/sigma32)